LTATADRYRALGDPFVMVEARTQSTGAACEALGGVRVHFEPLRTPQVVRGVGKCSWWRRQLRS
jgi:hypothetical protein